MNALLIKSVIFSEGPDTLETAENSDAVLVPDPDSENGYRVEEAPSTWKTLTEEEYVAESSSKNAIENMGLSSKFPFLFALTASICLVYLLNRFLKSGAGRIKWLGNILLTGVFFALFQHHWWIRLPRSVYYLFPVLEVVLLLAVISLVSRKSFSKKIYIAVTFQAVFGLCEVLRSYGEFFFRTAGRLPGNRLDCGVVSFIFLYGGPGGRLPLCITEHQDLPRLGGLPDACPVLCGNDSFGQETGAGRASEYGGNPPQRAVFSFDAVLCRNCLFRIYRSGTAASEKLCLCQLGHLGQPGAEHDPVFYDTVPCRRFPYVYPVRLYHIPKAYHLYGGKAEGGYPGKPGGADAGAYPGDRAALYRHPIHAA